MNLWAVLRKTDPRVLVLAVLTGLGVLFCIYQAATAFSTNEESPDYRRSPPRAFALPLVDTIVDPQRLTEPRLPDEAYVELTEKTQDLSERIAKQKIGSRYLTAQGTGAANAAAVLAQLRSYFPIYRGRRAAADSNVTLNAVAADSADTSQSVSFGPGAGGAPGGSFTLSYSFSYRDQAWDLTQIEVAF